MKKICFFLLFGRAFVLKIFLLLLYYLIYSETSWEEVVNKRLPREIGKRNFHPRFNSWSILSLGKVHLVVIEMNKNKYVLANVIKIPIIVPKTLPALFISESLYIKVVWIPNVWLIDWLIMCTTYLPYLLSRKVV